MTVPVDIALSYQLFPMSVPYFRDQGYLINLITFFPDNVPLPKVTLRSDSGFLIVTGSIDFSSFPGVSYL